MSAQDGAAPALANEPQASVAYATSSDHAIAFDSRGERLIGVATLPRAPGPVAVVIVVGGSQYRVGAHRQYVTIARRLAQAGVAVLRFDYRGMGDSTGALAAFDDLTADTTAAIDVLQRLCPSVRRVGLWGLCDGASAALIHCADTRDARIGGVALVNPWVRSETMFARTHLKHYYPRRLLERAFWRRVLRGEFDLRASLASLRERVRTARRRKPDAAPADFRRRMAAGLRACTGPVLLVLSRNDLTAREFTEYAAAQDEWAALLARSNVSRLDVEGDHTFSSAAWRGEVLRHTLAWVERMAVAVRDRAQA